MESKPIRHKLELLSRKQEALVEAREGVLQERWAFRSHGKQVQTQRKRTGDVEVTFMDKVRKLYVAQKLYFPPDLETAYDRVEKEREKLGTMEYDYFQTEKSLDIKELKLIDMENDLYQYHLQELFSGAIPESQQGNSTVESTVTSTFAQYRDATAQHSYLTKEFDHLRFSQAEILDRKWSMILENVGLFQKYNTLLDEIVDKETEVQRLRKESMHYAIPAEMILLPRSGNAQFSPEMSDPVPITQQSLLDGNLPDSLNGFPAKLRRHEWLLASLESSPLEKIRYLNILQAKLGPFKVNEFDYTYWEDQVTGLWLSDIDEQLTCPEADMESGTRQSNPFVEEDLGLNASQIPRPGQSHNLFSYSDAITEDHSRDSRENVNEQNSPKEEPSLPLEVDDGSNVQPIIQVETNTPDISAILDMPIAQACGLENQKIVAECEETVTCLDQAVTQSNEKPYAMNANGRDTTEALLVFDRVDGCDSPNYRGHEDQSIGGTPMLHDSGIDINHKREEPATCEDIDTLRLSTIPSETTTYPSQGDGDSVQTLVTEPLTETVYNPIPSPVTPTAPKPPASINIYRSKSLDSTRPSRLEHVSLNVPPSPQHNRRVSEGALSLTAQIQRGRYALKGHITVERGRITPSIGHTRL